MVNFVPIKYSELNAREKEQYNFQIVSARLAQYGYTTMKLPNDYNGADFLAIHRDAQREILRVQLKGRLTFCEKYMGKGLYICFPHRGDWYLIPHDECIDELMGEVDYFKSPSWRTGKAYSVGSIRRNLLPQMERYKIPALPRTE